MNTDHAAIARALATATWGPREAYAADTSPPAAPPYEPRLAD